MSMFVDLIETKVLTAGEKLEDQSVVTNLTKLGAEPGVLADVHHKVEGALRTLRFLAQKMIGTYNRNDPKDLAKIASIESHLATLEAMKTDLVDPVLKGLTHSAE